MLALVNGKFLSEELDSFPSVVTGDLIFPVCSCSLRKHQREEASLADGASMDEALNGGRERKLRG